MNALDFKTENVFQNFVRNRLDRTMGVLLWWWMTQFYEAVITSAYRNDGGIHGTDPLRALDLRSWIYSNPQGMETYVNDIWTYDPKRPDMKVCWWHDAGKPKNKHFHLQVHPGTLFHGRHP